MGQKNAFLTLAAIFSFVCLYAQQGGMHFDTNLTWDQIKIKAYSENKYILISCNTSPCLMCEKMNSVYDVPEIKEFTDRHFVSVKVKTDSNSLSLLLSNKVDNSQLLASNEYQILEYPAYFFLTPDGVLVHKAYGYKSVTKFLGLIKQASETTSQCYTLLREFENKKLAYSEMPALSETLYSIGEDSAAMTVADFYIKKYLVRLKDNELFTKKNLVYVAMNIDTSSTYAFKWFYHHTDKIKHAVGEKFSMSVICQVISREDITPLISSLDTSKLVPDTYWMKLCHKIQKKYNSDYANRVVLEAQVKWYTDRRDWKNAVAYNIEKIDHYGFDTTSYGMAHNNNMIYDIIFMHSKDSIVLNRALEWIKIILKRYPDEQDYLDTYANLLYKVGKTKEALDIETKAFSKNFRKDKEIIDTYEKMQAGRPTWAE